MVRRRKPRRGVVILVVLSLLVLFVLLAVTFAIVAGQYDRAARSHSRQELIGDDPARLADRAMYELVRGTTRVSSPLRAHDLLRDMYGSSVRGQISVVQGGVAGGQFLQFSITASADHPQRNGYYNGRVLTFLDGPAAGLSTRIVHYQASASAPILRVMALKPDENTVPLPEVGNTILINGAPFAGTGPGFNPNYNPLSADPNSVTGLTEHALLPNRVGESDEDLFDNYLLGGVNEGYDATDFQNMALAAVTRAAVIPSFHRPALIHHWMNDEVTPSATVPGATRSVAWGELLNPTAQLPTAQRRLRRQVIFRPMPWEHPNFTGSNPAFDGQMRTGAEIEQALLQGPWDIDNNNDGRPDSIWIDPDFPVQTAPDGRMYKPLIAVLCQDLDGRLNLNAHGNLTPFPSQLLNDVPLAGGWTTEDLPRGQGFGPAEINLNELIPSGYLNVLRSRYGTNNVPGRSRFDVPVPEPAYWIDTGFDLLAATRFYEYPNNYFAPLARTSFSSFFDLRGEQSFGVDHRGQPLSAFVYDSPNDVFPDILADNPYEFRLVHPGSHDRPFTLAELEKIVRANDLDVVALHSRLAQMITVFEDDPFARQAVTTHSFDPPVPGVLATDDFHVNNFPGPKTIRDMLENRLLRGGVPEAQIDAQIAVLLSPDLVMGLRMDINRPWGSGRDSNNNGIVDEHWGPTDNPNLSESLLQESVDLAGRPTNPPWEPGTDLMYIDHDNDGFYQADDPDAYLARFHFARHLYVLAMLLKDEGFLYTPPADEQEQDPELYTAKVLAQWAINVVTFRDADSIMMPFEYDPYPFDYVLATQFTWNVDGNLETDENELGVDGVLRRIVWGCERPELLLTETLAFHDFRTEDLDQDNEENFQQRLAPRGRLFVEIYNPWSGHSKPPAEFYSDGTNWQNGVVLNKRNAFNVPVWRLAVTASRAPDEPTGADIERTIYFAPPDPLAGADDIGLQMHFGNANIAPLLPGRYAVVGPSGMTKIGRRRDSDYDMEDPTNATRQIMLNANTNPQVHQVRVRNNITTPATTSDQPIDDQPSLPVPPGQPSFIQPAIAIPVDWVWNAAPSPPLPLPLSISEPLGGYTDENWDPAIDQGEGAYVPHREQPLDLEIENFFTRSDPDEPATAYRIGTSPNHRRIHLQRLANPLAPYHPVTNPYRTIDSMPVNLHRFNGVTTDEDPSAGALPVELATFQRGFLPGDTTDNRALWPSPESTAGGRVTEEGFDDPANPMPPVHVLGQILDHTLGYLNRSYGSHRVDDAAVYGAVYNSSNAPATDPFWVTTYVGAPDTTDAPAFPWLVWNNRPFISAYELLQVPSTSSARLLHEFTLSDPGYGSPYEEQRAPFGHLFNFFHSDAMGQMGQGPNLYRLLEYLQTPSPFIDADIFLNPQVFTNLTPATEMRHPPFNRVSQYRDPGKVNINTIYDQRVWDGIWGEHQRLSFDEFVADRRGYGSASPDPIEFPPTLTPYPSFFAQSYGPPGSGAMVPPMGTTGDELKRADIDVTLLRGTADGVNVIPRYANDFSTDPRRVAVDSDRNSYFAYQALQRLPNLLTTRSNVYAIWITIGYFEVEPNIRTGTVPVADEFHPDGYRLGQELGSDTGEITRHRAFYIVDRSIPVAFEPGQNHNVDRAILLRRFIE